MVNDSVDALPRDDNGTAIQVGSNMLPQDATATPNVSPKATSVTPLALVVPDRAVVMWIKVDSDHRFGDNAVLDATADEGYITLTSDDGWRPFPCADGASLYVRTASSTGVANFYFERI